MAKKKTINLDDLYISKLSDEQILTYVKSEIKRKYDLLVQVQDFDFSGDVEYLPGVEYYKFNRIERKNEFVLVELKTAYVEPNDKQFMGLRGSFGLPVYQLNDYDCVLANSRLPAQKVNEHWIKYVFENCDDPEYINKAKHYAKEKFDQTEFELLDSDENNKV